MRGSVLAGEGRSPRGGVAWPSAQAPPAEGRELRGQPRPALHAPELVPAAIRQHGECRTLPGTPALRGVLLPPHKPACGPGLRRATWVWEAAAAAPRAGVLLPSRAHVPPNKPRRDAAPTQLLWAAQAQTSLPSRGLPRSSLSSGVTSPQEGAELPPRIFCPDVSSGLRCVLNAEGASGGGGGLHPPQPLQGG